MEKSIFSKFLAVTLCLILAFSAFSVNVFAIDEDADIDMGDDVIIETIKDVYVSSSGNDSNAGTEAAPFATLSKASSRVSDGGTIHIVGTVTVSSSDGWTTKRPTANVTVTGGTLSLSANLVLGSNVTFKSITLSGNKGVYANGKTVTFGSGTTASAVTVYGGNNTGAALESTNVIVDGGTLGTVYGGSSTSCTINQVNLTVNSGTVANVIGGNNATNLTGNVTVTLNGGTITSSIFGGCYNEYTTTKSSSFMSYKHTYSWSSSGYVNGKVDVIIGDGVTLQIDSTTNEAIFAHSRHKTLNTSENSSIIFLSESKYNSTESILGANDTYTDSSWRESNLKAGLSHEMGKTVADSADYVHVHGVTADDTNDAITEGCTLKAPSNTTSPCKATVVTLALDKKSSLKYTGGAVTPMIADISGEISFDEPVITYSNNVNPGVAVATMNYAGLSVSKEFTIVKADRSAPKGLTAINESVNGKADGEILGLSTSMEISTDNVTFTPVTDTTAKFAPGTYYLRYAETEYYNVSAAAKVVIAAGEKLAVTFVADGETVDTKYVSYGETLTDIPQIPAKTGYDKVAPYWDVTDFTNIATDITVNAVYTINTYTVKYVADGKVISEQTVNYGEDAVMPELPAKEGYDQVDPYWELDATNVTSDLTVNAIYTVNIYYVYFLVNGTELYIYEVEHGNSLTDIPKVPAKTGYDQVAPYWDVTDFSNITSDIDVYAVYTINTYTVKYVVDGEVISEQTVNYGESAVAPEIPAKEGYTETAPYWDTEATKVKSDLTINAVYTKDLPKINPGDTDNDGNVNLNDLITLAQYVASWENTDAYLPALDINGDGAVDLTDVNTLAQYLAGWNVEISTAPYLG